MARIIKNTAILPKQIASLLKKGVRMTNPFSVEVGDEVKPESIDSSLTIFGSTRISGSDTLISENVRLGAEGPVTLINCRLGASVELKGGYFADSVFLEKASLGANAHVRNGCLLEEESGGNHCVGLKQTILFPFVTLGSLINFCDCLMAGGTSRKNHSEVGSSYIHFNYTPQQDKATPSLLGDVPRGVFLREKPIFLGGQGGLVGPVRIAYGTVIPAGVICRRDMEEEGMLLPSADLAIREKEFIAGYYGDIRRKVDLNINYVVNLLALRQWYRHVRRDFFAKQKYGDYLFRSADEVLIGAINERIKQISLFAEKVEDFLSAGKFPSGRRLSAVVLQTQKDFIRRWPHIEENLLAGKEEKTGLKRKETFLKALRGNAGKGNSYLEAIHSLTPAAVKLGTDWLQEIVNGVMDGSLKKTSSLKPGET